LACNANNITNGCNDTTRVCEFVRHIVQGAIPPPPAGVIGGFRIPGSGSFNTSFQKHLQPARGGLCIITYLCECGVGMPLCAGDGGKSTRYAMEPTGGIQGLHLGSQSSGPFGGTGGSGGFLAACSAA
jgi:hypothetical protein